MLIPESLTQIHEKQLGLAALPGSSDGASQGHGQWEDWCLDLLVP